MKDKWTIRQTASYFGVSNGLVCENLKLAEHIDKIKGCKNRKEALERIK